MMTTGNFGIGRLWLSVTYVHDVVFKVRACANVHVALTKYLGMADYDSYEVVIGTNFNGVTQILNSTDGTVIGKVKRVVFFLFFELNTQQRHFIIYHTVNIQMLLIQVQKGTVPIITGI